MALQRLDGREESGRHALRRERRALSVNVGASLVELVERQRGDRDGVG